MELVRVVAVRLLLGYEVELTFTNGVRKRFDLLPMLTGPIFEPMANDYDRFREVYVDTESGTIAWPNGADICPDVLYHDLEPA